MSGLKPRSHIQRVCQRVDDTPISRTDEPRNTLAKLAAAAGISEEHIEKGNVVKRLALIELEGYS